MARLAAALCCTANFCCATCRSAAAATLASLRSAASSLAAAPCVSDAPLARRSAAFRAPLTCSPASSAGASAAADGSAATAVGPLADWVSKGTDEDRREDAHALLGRCTALDALVPAATTAAAARAAWLATHAEDGRGVGGRQLGRGDSGQLLETSGCLVQLGRVHRRARAVCRRMAHRGHQCQLAERGASGAPTVAHEGFARRDLVRAPRLHAAEDVKLVVVSVPQPMPLEPPPHARLLEPLIRTEPLIQRVSAS
eukprot:scaffold89861_cov75-Phaeocystis_antarctica.AAC.1